MNKGRSGRRITTRTQENIEAVRQALQRNQLIICARRNGLGIPLLICLPNNKERLVLVPIQINQTP